MQDKMALFKDLKELREQILYWEKYQAVNNMGKWYASIRVQKLTEQLERRNKKLSKKNDK